MRTATHHSPMAIAYAQSLLELANERNQTQAVADELKALGEVFEQNPVFAQFLADPGIAEADRMGVIDRAFGSQAHPLLRGTIGVLASKDALSLLPKIIPAFADLLDEQLGKIEVDVTVAQKLDDAELENVRQKVSSALKKDAVVHQYVDESIIGGLVLRVGDQLIDASVKYQLEAMRERLLASRAG